MNLDHPLCSSISQNCLFEGVPEETHRRAIETAKTVTFDKSVNILEQGAECEGMYLLLSGHVNVSIVDVAGHQANLVRAGRGDLIGDLEAIADQPCLATCRTEPNTTALFWNKSKLDIFVSEPRLARNIISVSYHRLAFVNQVRSISQSAPVDAQIVDCLLRMSETDPIITLSQAYIAEAVGCSRQTVNRVLGKLRDTEIISLRKAKIEIHQRGKLKEVLASYE